jgi:peptidoglycan hydrolase-like protein with peptidoglycan-binding domain
MAFIAMLIAVPAFATTARRSSSTSPVRRSTSNSRTRSSRKAVPKSNKMHGQQVIESARVTEIQQALIREHYLTAEADGRWDATTEAAMQKYQADQGWQTKLMPDSRALKKLGLGPDYSNAINAKDSSFAAPATSGTTPPAQAADFAAAAGVSR